MTTLKDLLHDVQVLSIEAYMAKGTAEITDEAIKDYQDILEEILYSAEQRIIEELLGYRR